MEPAERYRREIGEKKSEPVLACSPMWRLAPFGLQTCVCVSVCVCERERESERARGMVGECIKLPSLGPGPLHMMDHSPKAKHLILLSKK